MSDNPQCPPLINAASDFNSEVIADHIVAFDQMEIAPHQLGQHGLGRGFLSSETARRVARIVEGLDHTAGQALEQ
jgi:hypothetical protein